MPFRIGGRVLICYRLPMTPRDRDNSLATLRLLIVEARSVFRKADAPECERERALKLLDQAVILSDDMLRNSVSSQSGTRKKSSKTGKREPQDREPAPALRKRASDQPQT
jgi:hypothetical protein